MIFVQKSKILLMIFLLGSCNGLNSSSCIVQGHLEVAGTGLKPFFNAKRSSKDDLPTGIDMDILRVLAKSLNMTLSFKQSATWGIKRNGTWVGTVGEVFDGNADIGIGHVPLTHERLQAVDFTTTLYSLNIYFVTRFPRPLPQYFNIFKPFALESWLAILGAMALVLVVAWPLYSFHEGRTRVLDMFALCLGQSIPDLRGSRRMSSHLMAISWLFFATIMLMAFECNLRAYLVSMDYEPPINNAHDLVKYGRSLYLVKGTSPFNLFKDSELRVHKTIFRDIVDNERYYRPSGGNPIPRSMEIKIKEEGAVIVSAKETLKAQLSESKERYSQKMYRVGKEGSLLGVVGFVLAKDSCLKPRLDQKLLYLVQNGVIAKIMQDNLPNKRMSQVVSQDALEVLSLDHLLLAMIFFFTGILASSIVFCLENRVNST